MRHRDAGRGKVDRDAYARHCGTWVAAAALIVGCRARDRIVAPAPPVTSSPAGLAPVSQRVAAVTVSSLAPTAGDTIVVQGSIGVGDTISLASFVVGLTYDPHALKYVDEIPLPGMVRVVNPRDVDIVVAGASGTESADGRLFALRFRVDDPKGLETLRLTIDEMNDRDFKSIKSVVIRLPALRLDPKLATAR